MEWQIILALIIAIPVILFPAAFVWYLNVGSLFQAARKAVRKPKAAREKDITATVEVK